MSDSEEKRRLVENQAVFRGYNERIKRNLDKITEEAISSGQEYLIKSDDLPLYFLCECSDENCRKRVHLKPSMYQRIHRKRNRFVIVSGHEADEVERLVSVMRSSRNLLRLPNMYPL
jgi:hypothetical protein